MTTRTKLELSPQAQAVDQAAFQAWVTKDDPQSIAAAALRAAAEQRTYTDDFGDEYINPADMLSIAQELETHQLRRQHDPQTEA